MRFFISFEAQYQHNQLREYLSKYEMFKSVDVVKTVKTVKTEEQRTTRVTWFRKQVRQILVALINVGIY